MTSIYVIDAGPLIDFLNDVPGGDAVRDRFKQDNSLVMAHALNLMEVFYDTSRQLGVLTARDALDSLKRDGLIRSTLMDEAFFEDAAQLKAQWKKVSLADCCGLALARRLNAQFVTTDRHELENLSAAKVADIFFTR